MIGKGLPAFGDGLRLVDDKARDRDCFLVREAPVHRPVDVANRHVPAHDDAAFFLAFHALEIGVVFILDVAHDLFEDVLQRNDAHQRAILVHHQGEVLALGLEGTELAHDARGLGDEPRLAGKAPHVDARFRGFTARDGLEQVLDVEDSDHVVGVVLVDGQA